MRRTVAVAIVHPRVRQRGLSLVELMIAMTIGLFIVAGIGYVYLGSAQAYKTQDAMARLQEGARYAFELVGKDLRMAGTTGCSYSATRKAINTTAWYGDLFTQPLSSVEKNGTAGADTQYSDALRILRADTSTEYLVAAHDAATAQFTLTAASGIPSGELLVATNCSNAALFQASSATGTTVTHATAGTPGNVSIDLSDTGAYTYAAGSRLYRLQALTYFVKMNPAGIPALYRTVPTAPNAASSSEELIEGVEDFQVSYAVDTTLPTADGEPDFVDPDGDGDPYLTAAQITVAGNVPGSTIAERWQRVVSARVSLLMRSVENNVAPQAQTYNYNGADVTAADRHIRKVFTHVIKLRNR